MRLASLALAALLLAPAAAAQAPTLTPGTRHEVTIAPPAARLSGGVEITQNSSFDITQGTVACASRDPTTEEPLGSTANSFWRVIDLSGYTLPADAMLLSADFGVSVSLFEADAAPGQLKVHTLPPGTDVSNGFNLDGLTELASADVSFGSADVRSVRELASATFDTPPSLTGSELLAVELTFPDGTPTDEVGPQFDARAGGNEEAAEGVSYLSTPDCGGIGPTPFQSLGSTFTTEFVVVLYAGVPGASSSIGSVRAEGAGATVTVEGTLTRAEGTYTYLQDATGGLAIRQTSGDLFDRVNSGAIPRGSVLRVTGTLSEFNGLLQISGGALASFEVLGNAEVPAPQVVTLAEIAANGEAYEGELVRVEGVTFDALAPGGQFAASTDYAATDGSGAGTVRVPPEGDTELEGTDLTASPSTVTGVVIQNSSTDPDAGYKVAVIALGDVQNAAVALGASPDGRLGLSAAVPNPSASAATVTVSMATAGPATLAVFDVLGRQVARVLDGPLAAGDTPVRMDVSGLPAGTYLVRLSADGVAAVRPLTVVR